MISANLAQNRILLIHDADLYMGLYGMPEKDKFIVFDKLHNFSVVKDTTIYSVYL